jgi:hypothetical protein
MKALLGIVSGFVLTLAVFASGLAFAAWIIAAKPVRQQAKLGSSVVDLWTRDARPVKTAQQPFERIPAEQPKVPDASAMAKGSTDTVATSAVGQSSTGQTEAKTELPAAHVEWCASRYRSYQPENNTYRSYTGRQRPCISPYVDVNAQPLDARYVEASYASTNGYASTTEDRLQLSPDHVENCFSRYRSYRPEDNTYQPISGGPRSQCL